MIESLYGSNDIKVIESKLADIEFKVLQDSYVKAVYNNIRLFPTHLGNVMEASPYLYYDVELLSDQYLEGYTSGIIRQIINYCINNNIPYTCEDEILFVNDDLISCNNSFFYNLFELEEMMLKINKENTKTL